MSSELVPGVGHAKHLAPKSEIQHWPYDCLYEEGISIFEEEAIKLGDTPHSPANSAKERRSRASITSQDVKVSQQLQPVSWEVAS